MKNKFKIGEVVLYQNGDIFELGIVKNIIEESVEEKLYGQMCAGCEYERRCHKSCETCDEFDEALEETDLEPSYKYRVWYHMGDTTSVTDEEHLHKINNAYAFTVLRKQVDLDVNARSTCRRLATELLGQFELYGDMYYQLEDWLTKRLEGENPDVPLGIEGEYLRCALRIELRDFFDNKDIEDIESSDIEECVDRIMNHCSVNVLDIQFISDIVDDYVQEKKDKIHFQVVYMYNSDKETEYVEDYTADEYEDACSDYKYFVEQKDCAYVILQKLQVIYDKEEKYILEEYRSEEDK